MTDVLIIGAGVSGLLVARELATAGLSVRLLDQGVAGGESSWAGGGILSPLYPWRMPEAVTALCTWSQRRYPGLATELLETTGLDPEWRQTGLLMLDPEDAAVAEQWCQAHGVRHEWVEPAALGRLEPRLAGDVLGPAIYLPDVAQARNPRLLRAVLADVRRRGVELDENTVVTDLETVGSRVCSAVTGRGAVEAGTFVITAGAWSAALLRSLAPGFPVEPVKGQMLAFEASPDLLRAIVLAEGRYLIPRRDGVVLCGSTVEYRQFDKTPDEAGLRTLRDFAIRHLPELRDAPIVGHWAGLRPGSPEGIPFIGRVPALDNLYVSCGHFRNGLTMAPASARLVADLILGRPPIVPAEAYAVPETRSPNDKVSVERYSV